MDNNNHNTCKLPSEPIALIGSSCRFAGGVTSPSGLWKILSEPTDLARSVPANRFSVDGFYHRDPEHHGTTDAPRGYFLDGDHRVFDAQLFNITPKEAEAMDPQQRQALEIVYEAFESAGYSIQELAGQNIAVYTGVMTRDYDTLTSRDDLNASQYAATGNARSIISNRISYFFDLHGPSMTIDTACSASLVALHQAVQSLRSGEAPMACVVGVNLMLTPEQFIAESKLHMLSPSAHCQMWDAKADGYARGEGVSAIFLKPLSRALADGDHIQAVIRETGVNSDGRTKGITMPSSTAQSSLIRQTYQKCGLDPNNADHRPQFFEAHGTGTPVGDPIEARAIAEAFFPPSINGTLIDHEQRKLLVGSVKTVIGHTEGAAGLAGMLKVIQAMENGCIPPNLHLTDLNPAVSSFLQHLEVPTKSVLWPAPPAGQPRRASVNSFGFGGTNAHTIVEKYDPKIHNSLFIPSFQAGLYTPLISSTSKISLPLVFSAASEKSLVATLKLWRQFLADNPTTNDQALGWHLYRHRTAHSFRTAIEADGIPSAVEKLDKLIASGKKQNKIGHRSRQHSIVPKVLGIFTGQGAQYVNMSKELFQTNSVYRATIKELEQVLRSCPDPPDEGLLQKELLAEKESSRLGKAQVSQVLCTALQIALVDLLASLGVKFHAVVGHSSGEIAAAYAAKRLSRQDAILIAYYRGKYTHLARSSTQGPGGMLACSLPEPQVSALCSRPEYQNKLFIAASNSPTLTTLSGDLDAIQQAMSELKAQGTFVRQLHVDVAYHSPHMQEPVMAYSKALSGCDIQPLPHGQGPIWVSSVYRHPQEMTDLANQYWCDNMLSPVMFREALEAVLRTCGPFDCAIEVGPHPALKAPFQETMKSVVTPVNFPYLSVLDRTKNDRLTLAAFLGGMWTNFGPNAVNITKHVEDNQFEILASRLADAPTYAWDHSQVHWRESRLSEQYHFRKDAPHELLGVRTNDDTPSRLRWRNILKLEKLPWVEGHKFQGQALLPASAYCIMALDAALVLLDGRKASDIELEGLEFLSGITLEADAMGVETMFTLSVLPYVVGTSNNNNNPTDSSTVIEAEFDLDAVPVTSFAIPPMKKAFRGRVRITLDMSDNGRLPRRPQFDRAETLPVDVEAFYDMMQDVGLEYTGPFKALKSLDRRLNYARGTLDLRHASETTELVVCPAMLDSCFHTTFATFSSPGDKSLWTTFLPTKIARLCFNIATGNPFEDHDEVLVETYLTSVKPHTAESAATMTSNLEVWYSEIGQLAIQLEGLTVSSFAEAKPANDYELYLHTIFELDPEDEIVTVLSPSYGDLDPYSFKADSLIPTTIKHKKPSTPPPASSPTDDDKLVDHSTRYRMAFAGTHWNTYVVNRALPLRPMSKPVYPVKLLAERHKEQLPGFRKHLGRIAQQLAHKYPRMRILDLTEPDHGLTEGILERLNSTFLSYNIGRAVSDATLIDRLATIKGSHKIQNKVLDGYLDKINNKDATTPDLYDLVILSSSTLPDSSTPVAALKHIRTMTRDGGFLIFIDMISPSKVEESQLEKIIPSATHWPKMLERQYDFAATARNCDQDYPAVASLCVRQAGGRELTRLSRVRPKMPVLRHLLIVGCPCSAPGGLARSLQAMFKRYCDQVTTAPTLEEVPADVAVSCTAVLLMADIDEAVCTAMNEQRLDTLKALVRPEMAILWVTMHARDDPDRASALGLTRSLKAEVPNLTLQVLDLGRMRGSVDLIFNVFSCLCARHDLLQDGLLKGRLSGHIEPELHMGLGRVFLPRVVPYRPAIDRLNAYRRVVTTEVNTLETPVQLRTTVAAAATRYHHNFHFMKNGPVNEVGSVLVNVEYSSLQRVSVPLGGVRRSYYVYAGRLADSGKAVVGLSEVSASVVRVRPVDMPILIRRVEEEFVMNPESSLLHLVTALWQVIVATDIVNHRTGGDRDVVLVEPDQAMLDAIRHILQSDPITRTTRRLRVLSSDRAFVTRNNTEAVYVHPWSTAREVGVALSSFEHCAVVNFLGPGHRLSVTLANNMQGGEAFQYYHSVPGSFLSEENSHNTNNLKFGLFGGAAGGATGEFWKTACDHALQVVSLQCQQQDGRPEMSNLSSATPAQILENNAPTTRTTMINWAAAPLVTIPLQPLANPGCLRKDRTYLLIGLTRDLGQSLCRLFLSQGARHIVVASRNPDARPAWVAELNAQGAHIVVERVDVTCLASVQALQARLAASSTSTPPRVGGLVNAAMVLDDRVFSQMDLATWDRVMDPKALGSKNLDAVFSPDSNSSFVVSPSYNYKTEPDNLDFFIMTSSFAAIGGHAGQANYAAANMYMNGLAARRRRRGLAATALNIGVIYGLGLLAREDRQATYQGLARDGYPPISERDLHHMFMEAIEAGRAPAAAAAYSSGLKLAQTDLTTGLARYRVDDPEPMHWHLDRRFSHFTVDKVTEEANNNTDIMMTTTENNKQTLKEMIQAAGANTEEVARGLLDALCRRIEAILQHPTGNILSNNNNGGEASFAELGVDSLAAVEIRNWVYKAVGQDVPVMKILGASSIARLCDDIAEKIVQGRSTAAQAEE